MRSSTYYSMLHRKPMGKYHVQICTNISCLLVGGEELWDKACHKLGIGHKQVTADGRISLEEVECIGACSWAPADSGQLRLLSRRDPGATGKTDRRTCGGQAARRDYGRAEGE